ncbi:hypothetical protein A8W25_30905 [Streptomyces sp. ERV7]|nr:hypothetical protein A8W25_30895 [Streptomyces sp. ERV7]OAR21857.1 hypothetical protein A8W25_30905 [Streptomyces sp. ERV7]
MAPVFALEAILRLQGGCCAVACTSGVSEWPADGRELTRVEYDVAAGKIAALWQRIGFQSFADGVYLRDTALDYSEFLRARRVDLAQLLAEFRAARR